jgi:hypothetical protein
MLVEENDILVGREKSLFILVVFIIGPESLGLMSWGRNFGVMMNILMG